MREADPFERLPAVTYVATSEDGRLLNVSTGVEELLGYTPGELLDDPDLWRAALPDAAVGPARTKGGGQRWVLRHERTEDDHVFGLLTDASPVRAYLDAAGTIIVVLDRAGGITFVNETGSRLLGYQEGELIGRDWFDTMVPERDREAMRASFEAMMAGARGPVRQHEDTTLAKDGRPVVIAWQHQVLGDEDGRPTGLMSSGLDVTERRAAEDEIAYLAYHDPLTGLPNRSLLQEHLDVALARARRQGTAVALLYLDLDDFKLVNDSLGHAAGDRLLTKVALRLANRHRTSDVLARQGGDEFLLLLSDLPPDEAEAVARTTAGALVASLQMPFVIGGAEFHIGASVGISLFPRDAEDAETLLGHADAAMYQAKAAGRDEVRAFHPERGEPLRRLSMTSRLRAAMDADELVVHWQPIVDPATGSLESLEALVRWQDPLRGLVLPGEFVPFAEETGLIRRLGEHVLTLICRQRREWSADGLYPHVTMNVSARQLEPSFPPLVRAVHEEFGVDPAGLTIEITETAAMQEGPRVEQVLADVADSGVQIAIDDFGAGYSSLSRLRRLPVAMLKIDRQFLADAPSEPAAAAIVTAVLELSEALGMKTVAEGVEAEDQRRFLVGLNCPLAQGFLLGRPVPADEVTAMLRRDAVAGRH